MLLNITAASRSLGFSSRTTLQRLIKAGELAPYLCGVEGRGLLLETEPEDLPSLREAVQRFTTARVGSPLWSESPSPGLDWDAIARECNEMMDPNVWGTPPWSADRWAGLAGVLKLVLKAAGG